MKMLQNVSLKPFNTFGVEAIAKKMAVLESTGEIIEFVRSGQHAEKNVYVLNGGSNILFTIDFLGLIIKLENKGTSVKEETEDWAIVEAQAGENWDDFVQYCLAAGLYGLENLSLIPGNVGAAPIQNIGAYGVEQKDYFHSLQAVARDTGQIITFGFEDCKFGYRDSIFKNESKEKFIILSVAYKLSKKANLNLEYGAIRQELKNMGIQEISPQNLAQAVSNIRRNKLPDPEIIGNAGSFFKNPVVNSQKFQELKEKFPMIVAFQQDNDSYKIAAGWMIEHLGWKGVRRGQAGVSITQALVLVNYGNAHGWQIAELSRDIKMSVDRIFGISLETEVNIV